MKGYKADEQEMLQDVARVLQETKGDKRVNTYRQHGHFSVQTLLNHFGHWKDVIDAADHLPKGERTHHMPDGKIRYVYKPRTCLQCDRTFRSWGPGNRKCNRCKQTDVHLSGDDEPYMLSIPRNGYQEAV
jgi:hypothetical protein